MNTKTFFGTITLEFYLIHPYRRPQYLLSYFIKDSVMQMIGGVCSVLHSILRFAFGYEKCE